MRKTCHRRDLLSGATAGFGLLSFWGLSSVPAQAQLVTPPDITTYARTPAVTDITVSPTGTKVAWVTSKGDDLFLNVMTIGQEGIRSLAIGKIKVWQILWLDEINLVVATSETVEFFEGRVGDKYEYFRARILNTETGKTSLMAAKEGGLKENIKGSIQRIKTPQGYRVTGAFYEVAAQDHSLNSRIKAENAWCLYSFAPGEKQGIRLAKGNDLPTDWVLTPTGYIVACSEFDDHTKSWILSFNRNDADKPPRFETVLTVKVAGDVPRILGLGQTDGTVLVVLPDENGGNWVEVGKDGTVSQSIDPDGPKFSRTPLFHPTTLRYAGVVYEDDWYTYKLTNPLLNQLTEAAGQIVDEGTRVELVAFAEDPRKMVVYTEAKEDPGSYNFVDFSTGDITFVAAKYPGFPAEWLQEKTPVKYKATDGLEIPAYLTLPPFSRDKNLPLIVLPHGGPRARDNIRFDWQVQLLASRGDIAPGI